MSSARTRTATIVLCGGPINYSNLPIGTNLSNAMIPVNGKPVIGWILDDLLAKDIDDVTVVLRVENERLRTFIERSYAARINLCLAELDRDGTIIESLEAGLQKNPEAGAARVILGDTLITDAFESDEDFVYVGNVSDARRWCLAVIGEDGEVLDYVDKKEVTHIPLLALAGYYHLTDADDLRTSVEQAVEAGERELSDVLRRYGACHPIRARKAKEWFDFGHLDNIIDARKKLLRPRHFNTLTINPILNTITKVSENGEKLKDELDWYLELPDELKVLTPRILRHNVVDERLEIVQEYYGYPTLAELYVYGELHADAWVSILRHVLRIHLQFKKYPGHVERSSLQYMYKQKLWDRLDTLCRNSEWWADLLSQPLITYNGTVLRNLFTLRSDVEERIDALIDSATTCIVHGDYCFSNILFDINNRIVRLIDPRGSFGEKGIIGDPRYDIAKLRHSVRGLYDYFTTDMFQIKTNGYSFHGEVYANGVVNAVGSTFDELIDKMGYSIDEIRLIEGLLFISMLPLHGDQPERQQMMFVKGLSLINDVCS
ncbi:MAG: phosphotransferase [Rhodothermales bacterium]